MTLLLAGLVGVVVGALVATVIILYVFQKRTDRDLIERRLRACCEYRECLGGLESAFSNANGEAAVLEQAWHNVAAFCREFRTTGWLLEPEVYDRLEALVAELEHESRAQRADGGGSGGRVAQLLCEKQREVDAILRREIAALLREHRRQRHLPESGAGRSEP